MLGHLITETDDLIEKSQNGPIDEINQLFDKYIPISGCSLEDFDRGVRRSKYFSVIDNMGVYHVAVLTNGGVEVGFSYFPDRAAVTRGYAMVSK